MGRSFMKSLGAWAQRLLGSWRRYWTLPCKELKIGINYREEGAEHTWTANDFATKWVQRMSFTVVKFRAMTVLAGLRKAAMAAH